MAPKVHKRSLWTKDYYNTSSWPVVNQKSTEPEMWSAVPLRADGCLRVAFFVFIIIPALFGIVIALDVILQFFGLVRSSY